MNYNIRGENIEITSAIREYAEKKIGRIERYLEKDSDMIKVNVHMRTYSDKSAKVEVTVLVKQLVLRAEEKSKDLYASIDLVVEKIERQIRKHKTKVNRKSREKGQRDLFAAIPSEPTPSVQEEEEIEIVRTKHFSLKPMDSEEAILQMNLLGHNFYVYADAETDETSVVYKRNDGKYGLIQVD